MELLTPGIGLFFWQAVVFIAVFLILTAFVWKPVSGALKTREHTIADALEAAERAREEMAQIKADNDYLLQEARTERDEIIKQATDQANKIKDDAKAETTAIAEKIMADARANIESEKNAALAEVKNLVSSLSLEIAERVIREKLRNDRSQEELVKTFLNEAKVN